MFRLTVCVLVGASLAGTALAAPATSMRTGARPSVPDVQAPTAPTTSRTPPPTGPEPQEGLGLRDQAIQQMRGSAAAEAQQNAVGGGRSLTTFAPGGEQLLRSVETQGAAAQLQTAREQAGMAASDAVASLQPGVRSIDGRSSQARISVGTAARLVVAGFAPQSLCDLQVRVLSRALPDTYPLHKDEHLSADLNFHGLPGGGDGASSTPSRPPQRELPVTVVGGDVTALCNGSPTPQVMRPRAYSLTVMIPPGLDNGRRTGGFEDDADAVLEVRAGDGTVYQMSGVTLVALREPLHLTIFRAGPLQTVYKVTYGDWKPLGVAPYRFAEGQSIDCPANGGGDLISFNGMKHGFALVSANMITDRVDTGDGDGFHNAGSRVMLGAYGITFNDNQSFFAGWGVWRSHRSEIGITSGMGAVVDVRPAHDICLSNYYLSVTLVGPLDMAPW